MRGWKRGERGKRGESSASKQVPAPSAPTYKNLFLLPHGIATDIIYDIIRDGWLGHKNLFMAFSGPLNISSISALYTWIYHFAAVFKWSTGQIFLHACCTCILICCVFLVRDYGAVVLYVAEQSSPRATLCKRDGEMKYRETKQNQCNMRKVSWLWFKAA